MSTQHPEINDNEIRIIVSDKTELTPVVKANAKPPKRRGYLIVCLVFMLVFAVALIGYLIYENRSRANDEFEIVTTPVEVEAKRLTEISEIPIDSVIGEPIAMEPHGYVDRRDTVIGKSRLVILTPENLKPTLHVGGDVLNDSTVKFLIQAADVRKDNGGIVGAFVQAGELLSKGQAKSGFCAIIGGRITVGVADATPLLEQAIETDGYFFRQYPLVVANQIVENKPKGAAFRKALAELDGRIVVIVGRNKLSFHDFSQSLVDLGVTNAIYLVGASTYGFSIGPNGEKTEFSRKPSSVHENVSYLVWR